MINWLKILFFSLALIGSSYYFSLTFKELLADPNFFFGSSKGTNVSFTPGTHTFTLTPPAGYKCSTNAIYETRDKESFNGCSVNLTLTKNNASVFIWYFLEKINTVSTQPSSSPNIKTQLKPQVQAPTASQNNPPVIVSINRYSGFYPRLQVVANDSDKDKVTLSVQGLPFGSFGPYCYTSGQNTICNYYLRPFSNPNLTFYAKDSKGLSSAPKPFR